MIGEWSEISVFTAAILISIFSMIVFVKMWSITVALVTCVGLFIVGIIQNWNINLTKLWTRFYFYQNHEDLRWNRHYFHLICCWIVFGFKMLSICFSNSAELPIRWPVVQTQYYIFRFFGWDFRSSHLEVFLVKRVLKICRKFIGEYPCQSVISIKLQCNFIEITLTVWVFSCKFAAYFQNTFY